MSKLINTTIADWVTNDNGWLARTFDPSRIQMNYNSAEAQIDRDFQSSQAQIDRDFQSSEALLGRQHSTEENALDRAFNSAEAQKNRDFQLYMSNTAYQRAKDDLSKAGLNPYLAYSQGGASTPTGSSASHSGANSPTASGRSVSGSRASAQQSLLGASIISMITNAITSSTTRRSKNITRIIK